MLATVMSPMLLSVVRVIMSIPVRVLPTHLVLDGIRHRSTGKSPQHRLELATLADLVAQHRTRATADDGRYQALLAILSLLLHRAPLFISRGLARVLLLARRHVARHARVCARGAATVGGIRGLCGRWPVVGVWRVCVGR